MTTVTMKFDSRPAGDPIELPNVGLFPNVEKVVLEQWQKDALLLHYGLSGTAFTFPLKPEKADDVVLNMTGETATVETSAPTNDKDDK